MQPKKQISSPQLDMFRNRLENILNHRHELYRLSELIDWEVFESEFGKLYAEEGRPRMTWSNKSKRFVKPLFCQSC
jgi:transposase, IS5 family